MQLMLTAYAKGYDTVPMRGYNKETLMTDFNISNRYTPVLLIALGKAEQPGILSTRLPVDDITYFNQMLEA